ncbi:MAG: sulfotransferase domain-containing protein [Chloroflexi bacterium]|nr:sulfotransferase domain-containing protein [Chloroflexota bacterium]
MEPTIFHVTHVKSGSQWVYQILNECAPERIVKPRVQVAQFYDDPIQPGMIYPTVYAPRDRFESTLWPDSQPPADSPAGQNWQNFVEQKYPVKTFVVIRDLRDTLVSLYFSLKVSHAIISKTVEEGHRRLNEMELEEGFLYLCTNSASKEMPYQARIQTSWLPICQRGEALLVRYEDIIADEIGQFEKIVAHCAIEVPSSHLHEIISRNSFVSRAGRQPGEEDVSSHFRKGISGDWRNYFTPQITQAFKQRFGQVLIETGYEKDLNW